MIDWEIGDFLKVVLIVQFVTCATIVLDVPVMRQVIGFIYLSFVPGVILLRVLRIHKINAIETILLSAGLSTAFLMFVGLFVNELYPLAGILNPLLPQPLLTTIISITLVFSALAYITDRSFSNRVATKVEFCKLVLLLFCLPFLSILGATLVNNSSNNSLSLLLVILISGLIVLSAFSKKMIPSRSYPSALLAIAVALLFLLSFTSIYIIGYDINLEYYVFRLTKTSFHWSSIVPSANLECSTYNAMLSITILPTIYSYTLNMDGTWIFKLIYPLIFSLVPLGLYQIYQKQVGERAAFLSAFFFISFNTFFDEMLGLTRQMIAELFFVLLILLLLDREITQQKKVVLSLIFGAALVVSHYSLSYMFMFFILVACLFLPLFKNVIVERDRTLNWFFVSIYLIMAFSWYTYTSASAPLIAVTTVGQHVLHSVFTEFLDPATRGSNVVMALGMGPSMSPLHEIGRRVFQIAQFFIVVGVIRVIFKRREMKLNPKYFLMSLTSMAVLFACIVLPHLAGTLMMTRIYHITLIFLAPFFMLGSETVLGWIPKLKSFKLPLISIMLITFLLFQSGFVYEVIGDIPSCGALSKYRIKPLTSMSYVYGEYIHEQDVFSAKWLSQNKAGMSKIYADRQSNYHVLTSYGMLPPRFQHNWSYLLSNTTKNVDKDAYIYLGNLNVIHGIVKGPKGGQSWNITEISPILSNCNKIYSNGGSDIYRKE